MASCLPSRVRRCEGGWGLWQRCDVRVGKGRPSGGSSGGSMGNTDGCSSTTKRPARAMPRGSRAAGGVVRRSNTRNCTEQQPFREVSAPSGASGPVPSHRPELRRTPLPRTLVNKDMKKAGLPFLGGGYKWRAQPNNEIVVHGSTPVYIAKA
jgi:hypothetical protein